MDVNASTIRVMGRAVRVLSAGDDERGMPVILIHGVGGWAENWRAVMEPIAASGRRAIAVDLPGFGESEGPGSVAHFGPHEPHYPRWVLALMDALKIERAHIAGNSMGGAVAYMAAVSAPDRFPSLTLVASGGLSRDIAFFLRAATLPGMIALARWIGDRGQGRQVLRTCFFDPSRIPDSLYEEVDRYGFATYPEFVRALRSGVTFRGVRKDLHEHWVDMASRYDAPVLVIWGREDAVLPIHHLASAKDVFPQAELKVIERCGHLPMVERPDAYLASQLPFLDRAEEAEQAVARREGRQVAPLISNG
jgi:4,5:9,10-diseco-3-hydroxy-5,9,17-trioxoandrosta-1(10),2-diene-4-oate hydrolase